MSQQPSPVICDGCGCDITYTDNSVDYRLRLHTYRPPSYMKTADEGRRHGGVVTDMMIYPAIEHDHHFCNDLDCLAAWIAGPDTVATRTKERNTRERG